MPSEPAVTDQTQALLDSEHLKLLRIFYLIDAGMYALFSPFGLFYAAMGGFMSIASTRIAQSSQRTQAPPAFFGLFFIMIGLGIFAAFIAFAALKFMCATRLRERRSRTFCLVVGALSCFAVPYGTALGVCTFLVLLRPSVMSAFSESATPPS